MRTYRTLVLAAVLVGPALARAQVGAWAAAGVAVSRASYEGRPLRAEYPFSFAVTFDADGTYRVAGAALGCGVDSAGGAGRWSAGRRGTIHGGPVSRGAIRRALRVCLGRTLAVEGVRTRTRLGRDGRLVGTFRVTGTYRYREGDEIEEVGVRIRGRWEAGRSAQQRGITARTGSPRGRAAAGGRPGGDEGR